MSTAPKTSLPLHLPIPNSNGIRLRTQQETDTTIRKRGTSFRIRRELDAIAFVQNHTSIPIPDILHVHEHGDDDSWFLMRCALGTRLDSAWPNMSEHMRTTTITQLKLYFQQLRKIHPSGVSLIGSCDGGPVYDHRLNNGFPCGPFPTVSRFHDFLVAPVTECPRPELAAGYRKRLRDERSIKFAHADLSWEHIFVDQMTGDVTGIIDWEMAGFWPEWWEYRKALCGCRYESWWRDLVHTVMPSYINELEVDGDLGAF